MHNEITIMSNNHDNGASLTSKGCYDGNNEDTYKKRNLRGTALIISLFILIYLHLEKYIHNISRGKLRKKMKLFLFFRITKPPIQLDLCYRS